MNLGSFRILLPLFPTSWGVGVQNSGIFNSFHSWVEFGTILEGLRNFGRGVEHPKPPSPSVRHWLLINICEQITRTDDLSVSLALSCLTITLHFFCMELGFIVRVIKSRRMRWAGHVARM